jgi:hypothetical protein
MPNINLLPTLPIATSSTFVIASDNGFARRLNFVDLLSSVAGTKEVDVPIDASSPGLPGDIAYDSTYIYICVAENTWRRMNATTF